MKRFLVTIFAVTLLVIAPTSAGARVPAAAKHKANKPLFDLPVGYYIAAGGICIGIGAAGGVAYAGIMGPKRRPKGNDQPD